MKPEPMTPADCDLRDFTWMPLDVVRLLDSEMFALSTGDEFKAAVALWCKAWSQLPAGSLPANERVLAHLSSAGVRWAKVRDMALRGWVECSDGRLYHPVVSVKASEAWTNKLAQRARTEAARAARQKKSQKCGGGSGSNATETDTGDVTPPVSDSVTETVTFSVTENVTGSNRTEQTRTELLDSSLRSETPPRVVTAEPPPDPQPIPRPTDARSRLWAEGVPVLRGLIGKSEGQARALLGRLLRTAGDDCAVLLAVIHDAADLRPVDPVAWLTAAVQARSSPAQTVSANAQIADEWGLTSFADPEAMAAVDALFAPTSTHNQPRRLN